MTSPTGASSEGDRWVPLVVAAEELGCSVAALRKWVARGEVPHRRTPSRRGSPQIIVPIAAVAGRFRPPLLPPSSTATAGIALDKQQVEIAGRSILVSHLVAGGIEVARPERDRGVDLIAYLDLASANDRFVARPIQMKAASKRYFVAEARFDRVVGLLIAYVWGVSDPSDAEVFCLSAQEVVEVAETMGYTKTASWTGGGSYTTTAPSKKLVGMLQPFRMESADWRPRILRPLSRPRR